MTHIQVSKFIWAQFQDYICIYFFYFTFHKKILVTVYAKIQVANSRNFGPNELAHTSKMSKY